MKESSQKDIELHEVGYEAFRCVLLYIFTDMVRWRDRAALICGDRLRSSMVAGAHRC